MAVYEGEKNRGKKNNEKQNSRESPTACPNQGPLRAIH